MGGIAEAETLAAAPGRSAPAHGWARVSAFVELTKPGITRLVTLTTAAGFYLATSGPVDFVRMLHTMLGVAIVASGASALNQYLERDADARMVRTRRRPLPSGRLTPGEALAFASGISVFGILYLLVLVNPATALVVALTLVTYAFVYTPLKRVTSLSTLVGAVPGALPILAGWTGAGGALGTRAWSLFGILFLWQIPHFLALAWLFRDDYRKGGFVMLSLRDLDGRHLSFQAFNYTLGLVLVSVTPTLIGLTGTLYMVGALLLGGVFLALCLTVLYERSDLTARRLFLASVLYLPLLLVLMVVDKIPH